MLRTGFALVVGVALGACGLAWASHNDHGQEKVTLLSERDIDESIDGKPGHVSVVEVALEPGGAGVPHRHPGPVFGYVLEGDYELGLDDQPTKIHKPGETFYEPTGALHRVSRNPGTKTRTRVLAVVLSPRDAKGLAVPEPATTSK